MEMLGKMFKIKTDDAVSVHNTTQYRKLRQDWTDDERDDEDDVVFLKKGIELKQQNGFDARHVKLGSDSDLELKTCKPLKIPSDGVQVKQLTSGKMVIKKQQTFMVVTLILAMVTILALVALSLHRQPEKIEKSWTQDFIDSEGTSNVVLHDVDGDDILDIIFGFTTFLENSFSKLHLHGTSPSTVDSRCTSKENDIHCLGRIVSMSGTSGELIWEMPTRQGVRSIDCRGFFDVNDDLSPDCRAFGHFGDLVAFSPKSGHIIWTSNFTEMKQNWVVVGAEILDDINGDGVMDLVVMETFIDEESFNISEHQSKLLLVDGRTGKALGQPIGIKGRAQFSPVVHRFKDKSLYIIYGFGSQERPGSLCAISIRDFYLLTMSSPPDSKAMLTGFSDFKVSSMHFAGFDRDGPILKIVGGKSQGAIVPPLLFDADDDGEEDLLVASYDGNVTMYHGSRNRILWSISYSEHLVTREMVSGHFDDDGHLDVLLYLNLKLNSNVRAPSSVVAILSGATGSVLWSLNDSSVELDTRDFAVHTTEANRDLFLFWLRRQRFLELDVDKVQRTRRQIRNSEPRKPHFSKGYKEGRRGSRGDEPYDTNRGSSRFVSRRIYGDEDYKAPLYYDQTFPKGRSRLYQMDDYGQPVEMPMFGRSQYKSAWNANATTGSTTPAFLTSTHPTVSASCKPIVDCSFLVAVDRYSTEDLFVVAREEGEEALLTLAGNRTGNDRPTGTLTVSDSPTLEKEMGGFSARACSSTTIKSLRSVFGDVDGDLGIDLITAATFLRSSKVNGTRTTKMLRISKLNLQHKLSNVVAKRLKLLSNPSSRLHLPLENYPLKASRYMTEKDLSHYTNFELKYELHNDQ